MKKMKQKKQIGLITVLGICILVASVYLGGLLYYGSHFLPNTFVNETEVSGMNVTQANEKLSVIDPTLTVIEKTEDPDKTVTEEISLRKMNADISYDASSVLNSQNNILWFTSVFSGKDLNCHKLSGTCEPEKLAVLIEGLACLDPEKTVAPKDAGLELEDGKLVIREAVEGNRISEETVIEKLTQTLKESFSAENEGVLDLTPFYDIPLNSEAKQLSAKAEDQQKILDKTIHFNIDSSRESDLKGEELASLLKVSDDVLNVDEEVLNDYVASFCSRYDISSSEYIERSSLKKALEEDLIAKEDSTINVSWIYVPTVGLIEVDISEQMLYYYENDVLLMTSPIVSGNPDITDETIHGHFTVRRMTRDTYLAGSDYLEHVDYWIGFDETGRIYGFHDASWRDAFGGNIWLTDPSRGCVNMPTDKVAQLYSYVDIGTEVYVHD